MLLEEMDWGEFALEHIGHIREVWGIRKPIAVELFRALQDGCRQFIRDTSDPRWDDPTIEKALITLDHGLRRLIALSADDRRATTEYLSFLPSDPDESRAALERMKHEVRQIPVIWPGPGVHKNDPAIKGRRAMLVLADGWYRLAKTKPTAGVGQRNSQGFYKFAIQRVGSLDYSSEELTRYSFFVLNRYAKVVRNWKPPEDKTP